MISKPTYVHAISRTKLLFKIERNSSPQTPPSLTLYQPHTRPIRPRLQHSRKVPTRFKGKTAASAANARKERRRKERGDNGPARAVTRCRADRAQQVAILFDRRACARAHRRLSKTERERGGEMRERERAEK